MQLVFFWMEVTTCRENPLQGQTSSMDGEMDGGSRHFFSFFFWYICGSRVMCIAEGFPIMERW